jgi:hypothetical protein
MGDRYYITREFLQDFTQSDSPPHFTLEAVSHIKFYAQPYLNELDAVTDGEFLPIVNRYPEKLRNDILALEHGQYRLSKADRKDERKRYGDVEHTAYEIVKIFMGDLLFGDNDEIFNNRSVIDPWDVEIQFRSSHVPRELFRLPYLTEDEEYDRVPIPIDVEVTVDDQAFIHPMGKDLVYGIITYYRRFNLQHPLYMYGGQFVYETTHTVPEYMNMLPGDGYTVRVGGTLYGFYNTEFMRGLLTAHSWMSKADPHTVITDLKQYKPITGRIPNVGETLNRETIDLNY